MAPKPKKASTSDKARALNNRAYDLRNVKKVNATPAEKAKRARQSIDATKTAARANAIANREDKKKAAAKKASYSPAPMSAAAKKKAAAQGKKMAESTLKKNLKPLNNDKTSKAPKKPLVETNRIGGIISVPKKPKKEIY